MTLCQARSSLNIFHVSVKVSDINLHPRTHTKTQNKFVAECCSSHPQINIKILSRSSIPDALSVIWMEEVAFEPNVNFS